MPNHVKNIIVFKGDDARIAECMEAIRMDGIHYPSIDFEKIIPMPESLRMDDGTVTEEAVAVYMTKKLKVKLNVKEFESMFRLAGNADIIMGRIRKNSKEELDKLYELGEQYMYNKRNYGEFTWYRWCIANWGTKWNAYDFSDGCGDSKYAGECMEFYTAWSRPEPVIAELARMYPDLTIVHHWADEDIGSNCGKAVYENGICVICLYSYDCNNGTIAFSRTMWNEWDLQHDGCYSIDYGDVTDDIRLIRDCEPLDPDAEQEDDCWEDFEMPEDEHLGMCMSAEYDEDEYDEDEE